MDERAARERVGVGLEPVGLELALDQPVHRAGGERLQRAGRDRPRGDARGPAPVGQDPRRRRIAEPGAAIADPAPAPVDRCEGLRDARSRSVGACSTLHTTSASSRRAALLAPVGREQLGDVLEERRRDHDVAVLIGAAVAESDPLGRARDARVQQVALAVERVGRPAAARGPLRAPARAGVVVEERVAGDGLRTRELPLAQAGDEHPPEAPGADRQRLGDQHRARRAARRGPAPAGPRAARSARRGR